VSALSLSLSISQSVYSGWLCCRSFSGDIILEVNGKKTTAMRDVMSAIGLDVGKTLFIKTRRSSGREEILKVITAASLNDQ
jgi:S1-C subfamily serine protease